MPCARFVVHKVVILGIPLCKICSVKYYCEVLRGRFVVQDSTARCSRCVKPECPARVPYKSFSEYRERESALPECATRVPSKSVRQECLTRVSHKSVLQERLTRVCHKSVTQECPTRLSEKCVKQGCSARVAFNAIEHLLFDFFL